MMRYFLRNGTKTIGVLDSTDFEDHDWRRYKQALKGKLSLEPVVADRLPPMDHDVLDDIAREQLADAKCPHELKAMAQHRLAMNSPVRL